MEQIFENKRRRHQVYCSLKISFKQLEEDLNLLLTIVPWEWVKDSIFQDYQKRLIDSIDVDSDSNLKP